MDSGVYMFHRNLFKVTPAAEPIRVTAQQHHRGGQTIGTVSNWLVTSRR